VEAVCGHGLDTLESLVDKSLVRQEEDARGQPRFRMYEMLREFTLEQLDACGEEEAARQAHAIYFLEFAEQAEPKLASASQREWLDRLEAEHDNLRRALRWLLDHHQMEQALRLSSALWEFWYARGYLGEGRRWLQEVLSATREPLGESWAASRAKALNGAGVLAHYQGDLSQAATLSGESLRLYRRLNDKRGIAAALHGLAIVSRSGGDYASARAMYEEAVALLREVGDTWGTAYALFYLGTVYWLRGDYDEARRHVDEALALAHRVGDQQGVAMGLTVLGYIAHSQGDDSTAQKLCTEALPVVRGLRLGRQTAQVLWGLGNAALGLGDYAAARTRFEESIARFIQLGDRSFIGGCLDGLAGVAVAQGRPTWAARFLGMADSLLQTMGAPRAISRQAEYKRNVAASHATLGEVAFAAA
ncbi:MAG TPA: tetratricopeptide repeat protein, partial [Chloroflexota bacterium]|nr:tetratricopeptide repeat protein [Chloroflexota bacterium]